MHHNYGVISRRRTSTDCVWPVTLVAGPLYNLLWRASASSHLVQCNVPTSKQTLFFAVLCYRHVCILAFFHVLCIPCYCDACLQSSALRVGMKALYNKS